MVLTVLEKTNIVPIIKNTIPKIMPADGTFKFSGFLQLCGISMMVTGENAFLRSLFKMLFGDISRILPNGQLVTSSKKNILMKSICYQ